MDPPQQRVALLGRDSSALDGLQRRGLDACPPTLHQLVARLEHDHVLAGQGGDLGDARTHEAASNDPDRANVLGAHPASAYPVGGQAYNHASPERKAIGVRERQITRGFPMLGIAVTGLVLGHLATYAVLYPDPDHRVLELSSTGHAYLPAFAHLAGVLAAAAVAVVVGRAWGEPEHTTAASFARLAVVLAITQASAFVGQEIMERALSGSPLRDVFVGPLLPLGVGAQVTLALIGAAIVTWLGQTTRRLVARIPSETRARVWRPRALVLVAAADCGPATPAFVGLRLGRSPPSV